MEIKGKFFEKQRGCFTDGFTLVETIIAIAIFVIGIQATVMVFSVTMKNKAYSLEMGKSAFVVSRSIGDLTQYLRRAKQSDRGEYPIVSTNDNDLVIYTDYDKDGKTEKIHVYLLANKVYMEIMRPSNTFPVTYPSSSTEKIQLADHIVNTASDPMFSYYGTSYSEDTNADPISNPNSKLSEIRLIKIFLKINIDPNRAPDNIQQETFIELRNLNDYDRIH